MSGRLRRLLLALGCAAALLLSAGPWTAATAQPMEMPAGGAAVVAPAGGATATDGGEATGPGAAAAAATLSLNNRRIATFRATLLGDTPQERAELARLAVVAALDKAIAKRSPMVVTRSAVGGAVRFEIDGATVFFLAPGDLAGPRPASLLEPSAQEVQRRLELALREHREMTDPRQLGIAAGYAVAASVVAFLLLRLLFALRRRVLLRLSADLHSWQERNRDKGLVTTYATHVRSGAKLGTHVLTWALALLLVDLWATFVLRLFAYTRPWGEASTQWLLDMLQRFALGIAGAVPGLLTAALIFVLARMANRANDLFMYRVERGEFTMGWLDLDTAGPTRRLVNFVIWLFALAIAYPYLPGAGSESFKGLTVLAGLMLSIGASSIVGQAMSGMSVAYSRSLRPGEYVKVGDTEGTVTSVGTFATKIHTGMGEEVSLPNSLIAATPVSNFSRLVQDGRFVLHTAVTIGYSTPWRQVHAMLLEAARRTPGVAAEPAPYVVQTALSDFYVEYRVCAQSTRLAPQRRAEAMNNLHANIQDVFNTNGVQIMSPHYFMDPPEPQVVPESAWFTAPAQAPSSQTPDPAPAPAPAPGTPGDRG